LSHSIGIYTILQQTTESKSEGGDTDFLKSIDLGGDEDLRTISTHPLKRASMCLYMALHLSAGMSKVDSKTITNTIPSLTKRCVDTDMDCFGMALVSLLYTKVLLGDNVGASEIIGTLAPDADSGISLPPHLRSLADEYISILNI
jgi:hypothetical protein